jgi:hypothetical protein
MLPLRGVRYLPLRGVRPCLSEASARPRRTPQVSGAAAASVMLGFCRCV